MFSKDKLSQLTVSSNLENLSLISDFIAQVARQYNLDDHIVSVIQLAVDEACTNIIQHGYSLKEEGTLTIICQLRGNDFAIIIRDHGKPFDPESISTPDLDADLEERKVGGLGLYFMRQVMDEVKFHFDSKEGNELTMIKHLT